MATQDTCCSIVPYFQVHPGKLSDFKALCEEFVRQTAQEKDCLYYGFSFDDHTVHCREGYTHSQGVLAHIENVKPLLEKALTLADLVTFEIHGPAAELAHLREPLAALNPRFFVLEYGFRSPLS